MSIAKKGLNKIASKLIPIRLWVQSAFLLIWLDPLALRLHNFCSPVFHCYSCPLATFACPIGVLANFSALHIFPFIALGTIILAGGLLGSLICGWVCPFGLLQDLVAKVPIQKFDPPRWTNHFRYVVLIGTVLAVPYFFGEVHPLFVCRLCPAGAIEGAIPNIVTQAAEGKPLVWPSDVKIIIVVLIVAAMFMIKRPWCRIFCPLGAIFGLFNRVSTFFLRIDNGKCVNCVQCRKLCEYGVEPDKNVNDPRCIRCLECVRCPPEAITFTSVFERSDTPKSTATKDI